MSTERAGELREDIAAAAAAMNDSAFTKRAVATVETRLEEGETVRAIAIGVRPDGGTGILVLTGRRLFWYRRRRWKQDHVDIAWDPGSRVSWTSSLLSATLTIGTTAGPVSYGMDKTDAQRFADILNSHQFSEPHENAPQWYALAPSETTAPGPPVDDGAAEDVISQLERLGGLYERGILDEDEFATAKADLLRRLSDGPRQD